MKCHFKPVELSIIHGTYHPMKEYFLLRKKFEQNKQKSIKGKFHKLAEKLERSLPRSMRSKGGKLTTEIMLEIINEEK